MNKNEILADLNRLAERDKMLMEKHREVMCAVHDIEGQQAENRQTIRALRRRLEGKDER